EKDTKDDSKNDTDDKLSNEEIVSKLDDILSDEITNNINDVVFMQLVGLDSDEREQGKKIFTDTLQKVLDNGVRIENISRAEEEVDFAVVENSIFDVEKTMQARNDAAKDVNPVIISSGDIIVREGQIITNEIYDELKLVGLLQQEKNILPGLGLIIFILFICA